MTKAIINKHSFFNWRFVGCSGDWESFEEAYGYSPQFLIEPEPHIQTVSWDEIFYDYINKVIHRWQVHSVVSHQTSHKNLDCCNLLLVNQDIQIF